MMVVSISTASSFHLCLMSGLVIFYLRCSEHPIAGSGVPAGLLRAGLGANANRCRRPLTVLHQVLLTSPRVRSRPILQPP